MFNANRSLNNRLYLAGKKEEYKTCVNKAKRRYQRQEGDMLANMKRANPRGFYKLFRKTKKGGNKTNLTAQDFCRYFSDLMSNNEQTGQDERVTPESNVIFEELDIYFSEDEMVPGLLGPKPFRPGTPRPGRIGPFFNPGLLGPL